MSRKRKRRGTSALALAACESVLAIGWRELGGLRSFHGARLVVIGRDGINNSLLLRGGQLRIDRQRQRSLGGFFAFRKRALLVAEIDEAFLQVHRHGIIHLRANLLLPQIVLRSLAILDADNILVEDVSRLCLGSLHLATESGTGEGGLIERRVLLPARRPAVQAKELDLQDRGLDGVQTEVAAHHFVIVLGIRAVVSQDTHLLRQGRIVSHDRSAIAERPEVFRRKEREAANRAHRAGAAALVFGADRLGGVLDDRQALALANIEN